jgi:chromosomal replication initiation ATPase DnaA
MSKKLKTYKTFENEEWQSSGVDINYEEKIDEVLKDILKRKQHISMLRDTIEFICKDLEKSIPEMDQFMTALEHYDDEVFEAITEIRENMIDGMPNIKDIAENVFNDFNTIEEYLKSKK